MALKTIDLALGGKAQRGKSDFGGETPFGTTYWEGHGIDDHQLVWGRCLNVGFNHGSEAFQTQVDLGVTGELGVEVESDEVKPRFSVGMLVEEAKDFQSAEQGIGCFLVWETVFFGEEGQELGLKVVYGVLEGQ